MTVIKTQNRSVDKVNLFTKASKSVTHTFNFGNYPVRTVNVDGSIWFYAEDIYCILNYTKMINMLKKASLSEVISVYIPTYSSETESYGDVSVLISLYGLMKAIANSKSMYASTFFYWITQSVLAYENLVLN